VFRSNRSGSNEIWESDAEGRAAFQLTHIGGALTGTPRWSPDGAFVAFDSRPDGQADIYTIPAAGGDMRRVTTSPAEDVVPSWSRDGRWIYFASNRSGIWQVWRAPSSGGSEEQLTRQGGFAAFEAPDGRFLYYAKGRSEPGLWRKRLPDGPEEVLVPELQAGFWGYWALAEKGVYFLEWPGPGKSATIWWQPLAGGARIQLGFVVGPPVVGDSGFTVSPDGRYLLYSEVDQAGSDLLILEHYR
jgi:Tol biopolymer transport system component